MLNLPTAVLVLLTCFSQPETDRTTRGEVDALGRISNAESSLLNASMPRFYIPGQDQPIPVYVFESIKSPTFKELFPNFSPYRLIASRDQIHSARYSILIVTSDGAPGHLQTDKEVATFLASARRRVRSTNDALRVVRTFADLRTYRILEAAPKFEDARKPEKQPKPLPTDYKLLVEERRGEWRVFATFFTDDYSGSCERYIFSIFKPPGAGIEISDPVLIRLRNYVY